jgi:hypothetical protein
MLAATKNLDILCLQLRNNYTLIDNPLRRELDGLLLDIRQAVSTSVDLKKDIDKSLSSVFNLRIKGIKWLLENKEFDLHSMFEDTYLQFEELKLNSKLEVLAENLLFAIRTNKRVVDALIGSGEFSQSSFDQFAPNLPILTYNQFVTAIALGIVDDAITQKIIDWTNASLYIEYIAITAFIIKDEELKVTRKTINQLSYLVANASQDYSAIALELGIIKSRPIKTSSFQFSLDKDFIMEQKSMADLGLDTYAANLVEE